MFVFVGISEKYKLALKVLIWSPALSVQFQLFLSLLLRTQEHFEATSEKQSRKLSNVLQTQISFKVLQPEDLGILNLFSQMIHVLQNEPEQSLRLFIFQSGAL